MSLTHKISPSLKQQYNIRCTLVKRIKIAKGICCRKPNSKECAVAWDIVEEVSSCLSHKKQRFISTF